MTTVTSGDIASSSRPATTDKIGPISKSVDFDRRHIGKTGDKKPARLRSDRLVTIADYISKNPLCRIRDIAQACGAEPFEIAAFIKELSNNDETKDTIDRLSNSPYHKNTINDIIQYGSISAVAKSEYIYPFTIGLYPAVSCMLSCNFCGRHPASQYDRADIAPGNELFRQVLATAPLDRDRRFYLSGGLEPLTNPGLAELVSFAASLGHRMQLYTNGMMLTPQFLNRHAGLFDLDAIRISLYGADDATAERTTGRSGVATRVLANARDFVRLKSRRGNGPKLGFNFVIQSGQVGHLRDICRAVADIAAEQDSGGGVAFLTLRENYAASGSAAIVGAEREFLRQELLATQHYLRDRGLGGLKVDFGYAMQGLLDGIDLAPVKQVRHTDLLGKAYPQISVVIDLIGDVYLYREAAFIGRDGAQRYIVGRLGRDGSLEEILRQYIADKDRTVVPRPGDELFLDAFDHAVTAYLLQLNDDIAFGSRLSNDPLLDTLGTTPDA
jgi:dTDP-4-amino-4,6-dideoxy-D-glucose ammonia-lyase